MSETRAKYGNRKVQIDGYTFDSQAEARRYGELRLLEKAGEIACLTIHPCFTLVKSVMCQGRRKPPIRYTGDFEYRDNKTDLRVVEDVKSAATRKNPVYRLKLHLMMAVHWIEVREVES